MGTNQNKKKPKPELINCILKLGTDLSKSTMRGFSKEMTFEHRQQRMRVVNNMKMWGRSIRGRREKRYKGCDWGKMACLRNTKKAIMAGAKWIKRKMVENEVGKISRGQTVESLGHGIYCKYNGKPLWIFLLNTNLIYGLQRLPRLLYRKWTLHKAGSKMLSPETK